MSGVRQIPADTQARQARASDPGASAWVSANAGSGKTHVLAQRVIRLLLEGCEPGRILCLTFTKAAAANMAERVFKTLSQWTAFDDEALRDAIAATGAERPRKKDELDFARKLFARAVETPGGLKIQTLHAFCERILHAAPFEANVAAGFVVAEDIEQQQLIARARRDILARAERDGELGAALERVADEAGMVFDKLLGEALGRRDQFRKERFDDLRVTLGLAPGENALALRRDLLEGGPGADGWRRIVQWLTGGGANNDKQAARIHKMLDARSRGDMDAAVEANHEIFFTESGERGPRKDLVFGAVAKARPDLKADLQNEQARAIKLREKIRAAETFDRSVALVKIVKAILERYEALKSERQMLDFDDLIARARALLRRSSARWILQKLDAGISHILVDEAQDTSAAQWDILNRLSEDFFAGEGQSKSPRTFFAVGDEKQSIFSFQGAEPKLFAAQSKIFEKRVEDVGQRFEPVRLNLSFRSAQGVLEAVDKVFETPDHYRGLSADGDQSGPTHEALKRNLPSRVEIWDVIAPGDRQERRDWRLPLDFRDETDPPVAAARRIAETIRLWLRPGSGETVQDGERRRPVRPGDIMILVRRRDAFFDAMIRALREKNVPAAGADRLKLAQHIAVMDLAAIGRAALLPNDDLTLATALKTPLFGLDDDDLIGVAPLRPGSLHEALRAAPDARLQAACARLDHLRALGRGLPPFAFYTRLLGPLGGRRAFLSRLGPEAGDALDEFLNLALAHERTRAPSLAAFLAEVAGLEVEIKRDMDLTSSFVRVMTVHAAKGLEAKIVFLPDVCAAPGGGREGALHELAGGELIAWSPKKDLDCAAVAASRLARREDAADEYRRLLYVAMTRAEERLYIGGHRGVKAISLESWRMMIERALLDASAEAPAPWGGEARVVRFASQEFLASVEPAAQVGELEAVAPEAAAAETIPDWLFKPAPSERPAAPPLRPSGALEGADEPLASGAVLSPSCAAALEEGRLAHRLLEYLPDLPRASQREAALRELAGRGLAPDRAARLCDLVLAILEDSRLAPLFGSNSVAEARLAARLERPGGGYVEIAGAIDRMAETEEGVWLADYKMGSPSPERRPAQVAQLALYRAAVARLYPGRAARCFLIHASGPVVDEIAPAELDRVAEDVLRGGAARN